MIVRRPIGVGEAVVTPRPGRGRRHGASRAARERSRALRDRRGQHLARERTRAAGQRQGGRGPRADGRGERCDEGTVAQPQPAREQGDQDAEHHASAKAPASSPVEAAGVVEHAHGDHVRARAGGDPAATSTAIIRASMRPRRGAAVAIPARAAALQPRLARRAAEHRGPTAIATIRATPRMSQRQRRGHPRPDEAADRRDRAATTSGGRAARSRRGEHLCGRRAERRRPGRDARTPRRRWARSAAA